MPGADPPIPDDRPVAADPSVLMPEVYDALRALAATRLAREAPGHTLQPTALVHEVYLKLASQTRAQFRDSTHFFAVAAQALRRLLVDHARRRFADKRDAGRRVTIHSELEAASEQDIDLLQLDEALQRLAELSPRQARVVELRYFGGLDVAAVAQTLDISETTVKRDWRMARAWLHQQLTPGDPA